MPPRHFISLLILGLSLFSFDRAFAKKLKLEWKENEDASGYEVEVMKEGKTFLQEQISGKKHSWAKELPIGSYFYRLRSLNWQKMPGEWSAPEYFAIKPEVPEIATPKDGGEVKVLHSKVGTEFSWNKVKGANRYLLEVRSGESKIFRGEIEETTKTIFGLKPGNYSWSLKAIRKPARALASEEVPCESAAVSSNFTLVREVLPAPSPISPRGKATELRGKPLTFKWKPSSGGEAYEFELIRNQDPESQGKIPVVVKTQITKETSVDLGPIPDGVYTWRVRSLANIDEKGAAEVTSDSTLSDLVLIRPAAGTQGFIAVESSVRPYSFDFISYQTLVEGTWKTTAPSVKVSSEYKMGSMLLLGSLEDIGFRPPSKSLHQKQIELGTKLPIPIDQAKQWYFAPSLKISYRDYFGINVDPNLGVAGPRLLQTESALGPVIGVEGKRIWDKSFSVSLRADYFVPVALVATSDGQTLSKPFSSVNLRLSSNVSYPLGLDWVFGLGISWETNTLHYKLQGYDEQISYSGFGAASFLSWGF